MHTETCYVYIYMHSCWCVFLPLASIFSSRFFSEAGDLAPEIHSADLHRLSARALRKLLSLCGLEGGLNFQVPIPWRLLAG